MEWLALVFVALFARGWAHPTVAGSCDSPRSGHHGQAQNGDGGYVLTVEYRGDYKVLLRLEHDQNEFFRGFQIICESCEFLNLPSNAQLNTRYCTHPGRVSHTNRNDKSVVEIEARLPSDEAEDIEIECYVVKTTSEWYGPISVTVKASDLLMSGMRTSSRPTQNDGDSRLAVSNQASSTNCLQSTQPQFSCMAELTDYFIIHWAVYSADLDPDVTVETRTRLEMLLVVDTTGWASLAFASYKGRMHPADAVLGWMEEDGTPHLESYHIVEDNVKPETSNSSLFDVHNISRSDNWLYITFSKFADTGIVPVNLAENNFINYATGKENRLAIHDRRGSLVMDFNTGNVHHVSSRKFYEAHGCLMIITWIILVPLSMSVARSKWSPAGMGIHGWLDLHRGIHLFATIALISALLIAFINFPGPEYKTGRIHRVIGILVSLFFLIQILIGILRPGVNSLFRPLFAEAHSWGGRALLVLGVTNVFIGISALHVTDASNATPWFFSVLLLLSVQICVALFAEFVLKKSMTRRGVVSEVDMVQIHYTQPQEEDSEEHYSSDCQ